MRRKNKFRLYLTTRSVPFAIFSKFCETVLIEETSLATGVHGKECVLEYFKKCVRKLPYSDFEELLPKYLKETLSYVESNLKKKKYQLNSRNLAEVLCDACKDEDWDIKQILHKSVFLELEYIARYSKKFHWQVHRLVQRSADETAETFALSLRKAIQEKQQNAGVCKLKCGDLLCYAVFYKQPKHDFYEAPVFFAMSSDLTYLFTKKHLPPRLIQAIYDALGCDDMVTLELKGRDIFSLMRLLRESERREENDRPEFLLRSPMVASEGTDYTQQATCEEYIKKWLLADVELPGYTVESAAAKWAGDNCPELSLMEVKNQVKFSGDVTVILAHLITAKVCKPPFPSYIRDFMTLGKSQVQINNPNSTIRRF